VRLAARGAVFSVSLLTACTTFRAAQPINTATPRTTTFHEVRVGAGTRTFLLHLPPAAATRRVPLVLVFHGHKGNASIALKSSRMNAAADSLGMAVVYADGSGRVRGVGLSWNVGTCCGWAQAHGVDDIAFTDSLRASLARSPWIDSTAIFAAGFSAGGMLAIKLACERAGHVRAVADLAGAMPNYPCAPRRPVGMLLVRGDDDDDLREDHAIHAAEGAPSYATSLDSAAAFWERANRCSGHADSYLATAPDVRVSVRTATGCAVDGPLEIVSIPHHPHAWPGGRSTWWFGQRPTQSVNGSALVLSFFANVLRMSAVP
jgi:polyhydroxybutyrate depolymerase